MEGWHLPTVLWKEARLEADRAGPLLLGLDMSLVVLTDTCEMLFSYLLLFPVAGEPQGDPHLCQLKPLT